MDSLKNYIGKKKLQEPLVLSNNFSFHWANWDETCKWQKSLYTNFKNASPVIALNDELKLLKSTNVWLCNNLKIVKTDLYNLYDCYTDARLRLTWFERKNEILFSLDSEQGPYQSLTSMKWFNKEIYAQFIMRKILSEPFNLRSFRLNSQIPLILKLDNDINYYHDKVEIHQVSEAGMILKFKDKNFIHKIKNSKFMEMKIPLGHYEKQGDLNIHEIWKNINDRLIIMAQDYRTFHLDSRILNFYCNLANAQRSGEQEFYIFTRFEDLKALGHQVDLKAVLGQIVKKTKDQFELDILDEEKKSA